MRAQVAERDLGQRVGPQQFPARLRDEYLPTVAGCADAGRAVHAEPDVAFLADGGLRGVNAHPHA
ncbi:MAG TPA: hypothetical protein VN960_07250 [Gaiellaceae bacterium]|nr:hypothetical protein [Gaiellaceae bacterium]